MSNLLSPLTTTLVNSPITLSLNSPTNRSSSRLSTPTTSPRPDTAFQGEGLLVPTDRSVEELEADWIPLLGRLRVEREVLLHGYALYALRTWLVMFSYTLRCDEFVFHNGHVFLASSPSQKGSG